MVKVEVLKALERHRLENKGVYLVHALVKVRSEGEDYVKLFVPLRVALQEGKEYGILFNGVSLRVKDEEDLGLGGSFDPKFFKSSGML
jgi:hypothetical protein